MATPARVDGESRDRECLNQLQSTPAQRAGAINVLTVSQREAPCRADRVRVCRGLMQFADQAVDNADREQAQAMINATVARLLRLVVGPPSFAVIGKRPRQSGALQRFVVDESP